MNLDRKNAEIFIRSLSQKAVENNFWCDFQNIYDINEQKCLRITGIKKYFDSLIRYMFERVFNSKVFLKTIL